MAISDILLLTMGWKNKLFRWNMGPIRQTRAQGERLFNKFVAVLKKMKVVTIVQRKISMAVRNYIMEMQQFLVLTAHRGSSWKTCSQAMGEILRH